MKLAQWLKSRTFRTQKALRMKHASRRRCLVERLEDRSLMATFTVALTGNDADPIGLGGGSYRTIQAAIVAAASTSDGADEVRVAAGNYNAVGTDERFDIPSSVNLQDLQLLGGWNAGFTTQNPAATPTNYTFTNSPAANRYDIQVLDADTTIDGFTFNSSAGATARDADTILSQATGTEISNNIFNVGIRSSTAQPRPAGVATSSVDNSGLQVTNNVFQVDFTGVPVTGSAAVGVFLNPSATTAGVLIDGNTFSGNNMNSAIIVSGVNGVTIQNNTINRNTPLFGAGIELRNNIASVDNSLIVNNTITDSNTSAANSAGGIVLGGSGGINAAVTNTTIRGNIVSMAGPNSQGVIARAGTVAASTLIERNSITAPGTGLAAVSLVTGLDVSGNWFGSAVASDVDAAISASGGGTIVARSYLSSGADDSAAPGLQLPAATQMLVPQTAATSGLAEVDGRIQSGIDRALAGMTVRVAEDTYNESPNIPKSLTLVSVSGRDFTTINLQTGPTYLGSLTIGGAGSNVTVRGFTINGRDGTPTAIAASNVYLESDLGEVVLADNLILVGNIDAATSNGDDGIGILTTYDVDSDVASLTVSGNIIQPLTTSGHRAFYINPGVDAFAFSENFILGSFARTAITQAKDGLVENNFVAGDGSSAGLGTWGFPDATIYGHTTFRANSIFATGTAITIFETNDVVIEENVLQSNGTGVLVRDFVGGVSFDPTTILITNNNLDGNSAFAVSNTTGTLVNASGNFYGVVDPADVATKVSADVDYTPWLLSGGDTSGEAGFQGDFSALYVDDDSPQSGTTGRIQEGIELVVAEGAVIAAAGTYEEQVTITKSVVVVGTDDAMGNPATILTFNAPGGGNLVSIEGAAFTGPNGVSLINLAFQGNGANNVDNGLFVNSNARLESVFVGSSTFKNFDINGVAVFGDTANAGLSTLVVAMSDVQFTDNGYQNIGGAGDINLFNYNGDVNLSDLTLTNVGTGARGSIQMRGVGSNTTTGADILPLGTVALDNIDISGIYRNYMITFQRYSDAAGLGLNDVALGGAGSALSGTFGAALRFDAVGTGTPGSPDTVDLGNTYFRGLATYSPVFDLEFAPDNTFAFLRADATDTRWNTTEGAGVDVAAASLSLAQAFEVEDRILHYVDADHPTHLKPFKGFAEVVNGNAYVTATFGGVIQRGVEMVDAGGTVNVKSGSYTGNVDATASGVNKAIALAAGATPGQVTINGNLTLDANDSLPIEIEGTSAASQFDNFIVTGSITLGGSTLDLSGTYVPVNGDSFTILNGSTGLSGMFAGLSEGDLVTFNGKTLQIRYVGATSDVVLTAVQGPAITSAASTTFTAGQMGSFTVTTSGSPTPDLSASGALPSGVTFVDNGNGTATLGGTPAVGSGGIYSIVITASNGVSPDATQNFTLTVNQAPTITSAASTTFVVNLPGSFTVTTDGFPEPDLSAIGALPSGVTFVDNGNGTATLSGTPAAGSGGIYSIVITASNGVEPDATQNFTLTVTPLAAGGAFLLPDPCDPEQTALIITGTAGKDKIEVKRKNTTQVEVTINKRKITLQASAFESIYVYGGNGNDSISIQHLINKEAFLFGEAGNDTIKAGGGRSVLVGGIGNDTLTGGKRRDVLIGGTGKDSLTGVVGDDIAIAGSTDHDANAMALCEILDEWTSEDSYSTRRATLSGTEAMPGLLHVSKVHDDGVEDKLEKTYDLDWYFANITGGGVKDKVVKPNFALITDI